MRPVFTVASVVLGLALAGCAPLLTQNPGGKLSPANVVSMDGHDRVMLKGADVVAYFTEGRHRQGERQWSSTWEGITFYFSSAENKARFDAAPEKYLPEFGGYCANGIVYGIPWGGDADSFTLIDGKLYIFGGASSKAAFMLDPRGNLALARQYWENEVKGGNALAQRMRRLVFRVPHYKSGAELAAEVGKRER
ncbi:MAG: YHS domain-containing (seleno)protein [Casimicrobiaceae bacterium]